MNQDQEHIPENTAASSTIDDLINALKTESEEHYDDILTILMARQDPELIPKAREMCRSANPDDRLIAIHILRRCILGSYDVSVECMDALVALARHEKDDNVRWSIPAALDEYKAPALAKSLIQLKDHPNSNIRYGVAWGLLWNESPESVKTLLELTDDPDEDVRNWATFGLASMYKQDSPEIREALLRRLEDENPEIRGEALRGLAQRDDQRVIEPLIHELKLILESDNYWNLSLEAAMETGDARLYPYLVELAEDIDDGWLDEAIAACRIPEPDETDEPDAAETTCPVCGMKNAFTDKEDTGYCKRCGWHNDPGQRNEPDLPHCSNRRSLNQERERWKKRLQAARQD